MKCTNSNSLSDALLEQQRRIDAEHDYEAYHSTRYEYVIAKCLACKPSPDTRVLDIGRSPLTLKLCLHYRRVTSLGFPLSPDQRRIQAEFKTSASIDHIEFDLNNARTVERLDSDDKFDLVLFAETVEHLITPPELVFNFLKSMLATNGIIICQTPNAVALHKRIQILLGYNPYERLRYDVFNPGHIREYTKRELLEIGQRAGLQVVEHEYRDYFGTQGSNFRKLAIATSKVASTIIPSLSRGQTVLYRCQLN
jgi:2-polyprenyl-3-methyl-5-hydroxy-6-metoxy-1,4-benzoquinol methylase